MVEQTKHRNINKPDTLSSRWIQMIPTSATQTLYPAPTMTRGQVSWLYIYIFFQ